MVRRHLYSPDLTHKTGSGNVGNLGDANSALQSVTDRDGQPNVVLPAIIGSGGNH